MSRDFGVEIQTAPRATKADDTETHTRTLVLQAVADQARLYYTHMPNLLICATCRPGIFDVRHPNYTTTAGARYPMSYRRAAQC